MSEAIIMLREATGYERESYGILYRSAIPYPLRGRYITNQGWRHTLTVWDNTKRPRESTPVQHHLQRMDGRFIDPSGYPTDEPISYTWGAEAVVISDPPQPRREGVPLTVGDTVWLQYPDMSLSVPMTLQGRSMRSATLTPVEREEENT